MRISDWSSDVCSSDLRRQARRDRVRRRAGRRKAGKGGSRPQAAPSIGIRRRRSAGVAAMRIAVSLGIALLAGIAAGIAAVPADAAWQLGLDGKFVQGGLVRGMAAPGARVTFDGRSVPVGPDGSFLIGFGRDAGPAVKLVVTWPDGKEELRQLEIGRRAYKVQRIDGLDRKSKRLNSRH